MNFDYEAWLYNKIADIISDFDYDIEFKLSSEQAFIKDTDKRPDILYITYKQLSGPNSFNVRTMPYQILIMSEQNQLDMAKNIANRFSEENNFAVTKSGDTFVKHSYQQPAVLSNFNQIDVGVRSILYIQAILQVMDDMLFIHSGDEYGQIMINDKPIRVLGIYIDYSMVPDTQALPSNELSISKKSVATLSISIVCPLYSNPLESISSSILQLIKGDISGNTTYNIKFYYGGTPGVEPTGESFDLDMKCISAHIEETPEQAPGLRLGFMM